MTQITILIPDPTFADRHPGWRRAEGPLRALLEGAGHELTMHPWTDAELPESDLVLPLLAWGYHVAHDQWIERTGAWASSNLHILNPPHVLAWNSDKRYLKVLHERGAHCVPTRFVDKLNAAHLRAAATDFQTDQLVVKPVLAGGAFRTLRVNPGSELDAGPTGSALIQPYLDSVETQGEISLVFFDGEFSHAVTKKPRNGDFRVQADFGGSVSETIATDELIEEALKTLECVGETLLYARVDMVRDHYARPALMELEAIEPELFLSDNRLAGKNLLRSIERAVR